MLRKLARPLLAGVFVAGGLESIRNPSGPAQAAKPLVDKAIGARSASLPDAVPTDPESVVKLDGAVKLAAGALLATGKLPRAAALMLAGSLVPTTIAGHAFWEYQDAEQRQTQLMHFMKNASMLGGLLLASGDTEGKPSVAYRTRRTVNKTTKDASKRAEHANKKVRDAATAARHAANRAIPA